MCGYFTIKQANDAIPHVKELYNHILECRKEIMRAEQNLESSDGSLARYIPLSAAADYKAVEKLESTGVLVKSIEDLLIFPRNGTVRRFGCRYFGYSRSSFLRGQLPRLDSFWHEKSGFG